MTRWWLCIAKNGWRTEGQAKRVAERHGLNLAPVYCDRCYQWHLKETA
jgi:hypothetical protein